MSTSWQGFSPSRDMDDVGPVSCVCSQWQIKAYDGQNLMIVRYALDILAGKGRLLMFVSKTSQDNMWNWR